MSHEIGLRDNQVGIEEAWHGLTHVVDEITEDNCGILYEMEKKRLYLENGVPTLHHIIVSMDDGLPVGSPVSNRYTNISNKQIWEAVRVALFGTDHKLVSVGTCSDRERGFISIKLADGFLAAKRKTESSLNILWGHGGCMNVIARTGFTVVVCRNTYNAALASRGDFNFKIRHTGDASVALTNMKEAIESYATTVEAFQEAMTTLDAQAVGIVEAKQFFTGFVVEDHKEEPSKRAENQIADLTKLFRWGAGNSGQTAADVFNAATNYYTHGSDKSTLTPIRKFEASEFGTGQERKEEVLALLLGQKTRRVGTYDDCLKRGALVLAAA